MNTSTDNSFEPQNPVSRIEAVWFTDSRIFIKTDDGTEYSQPLDVFPALKEATTDQRTKFKLNSWRDSIHWPDIDEDIHVSGFFEEETVNYNNETNRLLSRFPWLDMKGLARYLGMHWTKLARYRAGVWTPSEETMMKIRVGIANAGREMENAARAV